MPAPEPLPPVRRRPARVVLGMLGGIGSGKSYVARRTAELAPARVVDADALAHEALSSFAADGRLARAVGEEFVVDGRPDTKALGARAFEDPALLRRLERLVHPYVQAAIKMAVDDFRAGRGPNLLILDVPLLIEVGLDRQCDLLWFVEAPDDLRAERAGHRGMTLKQTRLREAFQSPLARKRKRADRVLRNDVDAETLDRQILEALVAAGVLDGAAAGAADEAPGSASGDSKVGQASP